MNSVVRFPEPGGVAVPAANLLDAVDSYLARFVAYPSEHHRAAHTLWIAHTHLMDCWESTPRIAFLSQEPASGKTRALEITENLVPNPVEAVNVTPSYLFRKVGDDDQKPTILFDEIDTIFGPKAKPNEEIRGLINAGHRKGAVAGRCFLSGKSIKTEDIPAYSAVAMAGLGLLPETILTRSVIIKMRRRAADEQVTPYRRRIHAPEGHALRERLVQWAGSVSNLAGAFVPDMPDSIQDRDADVWEPLLAVAKMAGGRWPALAAVTAVTLVTASKDDTGSMGTRLLADIKTVMGEADCIGTAVLIAGLIALDDSPWAAMGKKEKALDSRYLSQILVRYEVKPEQVRPTGPNGPQVRGYKRGSFLDPWKRYLPKKEEIGVSTSSPLYPSHPSQTSPIEGDPADDPDMFNA